MQYHQESRKKCEKHSRNETLKNHKSNNTPTIAINTTYGSGGYKTGDRKRRSIHALTSYGSINEVDSKASKNPSHPSFEAFEYEPYGRHPSQQKTSRVNAAKKLHLPVDAFYNPDRNMLYVVKGENADNTIKHSITAILELDRMSSYSTNPSDEDANYHTPRWRKDSSRQQDEHIVLSDSSPKRSTKQNNNSHNSYCYRKQFKFFDVYFNGEPVSAHIEGSNDNSFQNIPPPAYSCNESRQAAKFGGCSMKAGPVPQDVPLPSFI